MIVILWIFFSVLVATFANNRGRDWLRWLFVALILSPLIGVLLVAILDPIRSEADQRLVDKGTHRKCPACAEMVLAEARKCKHCGTDLEPVVSTTDESGGAKR